MYQCGFHWTDFCEIGFWGKLLKSVAKLQIWLRPEKNRTIYVMTEGRYIAAGNDKLPYKHSLRVKWYDAVRIA
jgi:hypothetical protein